MKSAISFYLIVILITTSLVLTFFLLLKKKITLKENVVTIEKYSPLYDINNKLLKMGVEKIFINNPANPYHYKIYHYEISGIILEKPEIYKNDLVFFTLGLPIEENNFKKFRKIKVFLGKTNHKIGFCYSKNGQFCPKWTIKKVEEISQYYILPKNQVFLIINTNIPSKNILKTINCNKECQETINFIKKYRKKTEEILNKIFLKKIFVRNEKEIIGPVSQIWVRD